MHVINQYLQFLNTVCSEKIQNKIIRINFSLKNIPRNMLNLPSLRSDDRGVSSINGRQFYVLKFKKKPLGFFWGGG